MPGQIQPPVLKRPIPDQVANELGILNLIDLNQYIQSVTPESGAVRFFAELATRESLIKGLICTPDGMFTGIPAKGTQGTYQVVIYAENESGIPLAAQFTLTVKPSIAGDAEVKGPGWWSDLKSRVWDAVGKDLPLPDTIHEMSNRPITAVEIYYLLQRFATLTIWDAYNLDVPGEKILLKLEHASKHYHVYDRGSCIIGAPKDLYSHERTLQDILTTAQAMAREVYKRGWTVQLAGFEKMTRAAWIEFKHLSDKHGKPLEILHYIPSREDLKIYSAQANVQKYLS
jgi:hypothetical protein